MTRQLTNPRPRSTRLRVPLLATLTLLLLSGAAYADWDQAVAAYQAGNYQAAVDEVQTYVEQAPDKWQGHWLLGSALLKLGRNSEGLNSLRQAYDLDPNQLQVQFDLAQAYLANGRATDATTLLRQVDPASLPANAQSAYNQMLAKALSDSGQAGEALAPLRQAASSSPNDAKAQFAYGAAAQNAGDLDAAVGAMGKAVQLSGDNPTYLKAYIQALFLQGRQQSGEAGAAAFRKAIPVAQKLASVEPGYDSLMKLGGAQLGAKDYGAAANTYRQAAQQGGATWEPHYYLGQAYTMQQQYTGAVSALQQALSAASEADAQRQVWRQLGFVYEKQNSLDQAIQAYQRAGDSGSVSRVEANKETAEYNQQVERENEETEALREEQERIRRELEELPGGRREPDR